MLRTIAAEPAQMIYDESSLPLGVLRLGYAYVWDNPYVVQNHNQDKIDGCHCPQLPFPSEAIIKGDSKIAQISAASILAKVYRDELFFGDQRTS